MKTVRLMMYILLLSAVTRPAISQFRMNAALSSKPMTVVAASALVNKTYEEPSSGVYEKSTATLNRPISQMMTRYDRTIRISYQICSINLIEWVNVRGRAADIMNNDFFHLLVTGLYSSADALASNEYVPLSAYAPLNVKLNFHYIGKTFPYYQHAEDFGRIDNAAPIHTKTMTIKK